MDDEQIIKAVQVLKEGGVIAYPTESVYGFGCDPFNTVAVEKIIRIKQRDVEKGLILIASDFSQVEPFLESLDEATEARVKQTWPGAVTWLWPVKASVSSLLKGKHNTLAVRVTNHPLAKSICQVFAGPIVSTSANRSNEKPATTADEVKSSFVEEIDFIVNAATGNLEQPTEIRDVMSGRIIRPAS